jgi:hypothetical protein
MYTLGEVSQPHTLAEGVYCCIPNTSNPKVILKYAGRLAVRSNYESLYPASR